MSLMAGVAAWTTSISAGGVEWLASVSNRGHHLGWERRPDGVLCHWMWV